MKVRLLVSKKALSLTVRVEFEQTILQFNIVDQIGYFETESTSALSIFFQKLFHLNLRIFCFLLTQLDFRQYLLDNDSIINEDLVAWVTIGMMHVPHSEDIPNTATAANVVSFFIRPFNYFDEDPSMGSTNAILITPTDASSSGQNVQRYGTRDGPQCMPKKRDLDFNGTYIHG